MGTAPRRLKTLAALVARETCQQAPVATGTHGSDGLDAAASERVCQRRIRVEKGASSGSPRCATEGWRRTLRSW
jgi:hypothetical protein